MPTTNPQPTVLVFLKAPRIGTVKTRLAASIGPERAKNVYCALVADQLARLPPSWHVEVHYAPGDAHEEFKQWLSEEAYLVPQSPGSLGDRLSNGIESAFRRGASSVVCIGADCPELGVAQFEAAKAALDSGFDAAYGPCDDGGYYLVALNKPQPSLFTGIPWSSSDTLDASLANAKSANLRVALLEPSFDIDDLADLERATRLRLLRPDILGVQVPQIDPEEPRPAPAQPAESPESRSR